MVGFQPDDDGRPALHDPETTEIVQIRRRRAQPLQPRDRGTLLFVDGPTAGAVVTLGPGASIVIGRGAGAQVRIPDETVSRQHARLRWDGGAYLLEDLQSVGGTWVDGERIHGGVRLHEGARVQLGRRVRLRFDLHDVAEQRALAHLHEAAMEDALTGAYTRRYLHERLRAEVSYASRHGLPIGLLMLDLDHFKAINDRFGHPAGDAVLRVVATQLKRMLRPEDVLVRYGGEELCILLRGLDERNACLLAERVRRAVEHLRIPHEGQTIHVTVSVGVAAADGFATPEALLRRADQALYRAKQLGRNRTCVHHGGQHGGDDVELVA